MLRATGLACARGGLPVLEGLDLTISRGEAVVLRGPNGSGKTTLLRTLAGLQPALAGQITADPDSLVYAGHADGLKAGLSVTENLTFWARIFGTADISAALRDFDLVDLQDRLAANLSAGQKRRLGLARLAVTGRALWLLDEPTVSLDAKSVARFGAAIAAHCAAGGAALMATHIDLGVNAREVDVTGYKARLKAVSKDQDFDEAFL